MTSPPNQRTQLIQEGGRTWVEVPELDAMEPFLISMLSDGDRWAYLSSTANMTAGRISPDRALFPYETDDRLHRCPGSSGAVTAVRIAGELWRPLRERPRGQRRLLASTEGDRVAWEETWGDLRYRSEWASCERYGFVRTASLTNEGSAAVEIELIDGLVDVLPYGLDPLTYQRRSNLSQAYKRNETPLEGLSLSIHCLEAPVSDSAEPEEVLRATVVWSHGLEDGELSLEATDLTAFEQARAPRRARLVTGRPGAHLVRARLNLDPGQTASWQIVADVGLDQSATVTLIDELVAAPPSPADLEAALDEATERLRRLMAPADATQLTNDPVACAHHLANVTYNVMRGGVPLDGYRIERSALIDNLSRRFTPAVERHRDWLDALPDALERSELIERARRQGDPQLVRLVIEYLPFSFSRRHGDPSRPWNTFSIRVRDEQDRPRVHYEGNWRDLFQNWEGLATSFPLYLDGMIARFVGASTLDGHNPYRVSSEGIDWEVPDPEDPWANIGYWGDHQVVYLDRLLAAAQRYQPEMLAGRLGERLHTYADVPYRLAPYEQLIIDPKASIEFDVEADAAAGARCSAVGGDGALVTDASSEPVLVTLAEKLLVTALARLSNLVPGGGIWMNTQRPEWNDANNALVGWGLSMVTAHHLRPFLGRIDELVRAHGRAVEVSEEVVDWMAAIAEVLGSLPVEGADPERHRRQMMDALGRAGSEYRWRVYGSGLSGNNRAVTPEEITALCRSAIGHLDATLAAGRRDDGLHHAYNIVHLSPGRAQVSHLPLMLEGQVAALSSGSLSPSESCELLDALATSALYRADQNSYVLAPAHLPDSFLDRNLIPPDQVESNPLLMALLAEGDRTVIRADTRGGYRFAPELIDAAHLETALDRLGDGLSEMVSEYRSATLDAYETTFGHHSHLGRSGTMHAYEGIGSIYWHMVTKLLAAVAETAVRAEAGDAGITARLVDHYERIRAGLGVAKTPSQHGAIPTSPYSHTPAHAGAQQPGMTGAVKELVMTRPLELGLRADDGRLVADPLLLRQHELLDTDALWQPCEGEPIELRAGSLGLTVCGIPVLVELSEEAPWIEVSRRGAEPVRTGGGRLDRDSSRQIFGRSPEVELIRVALSRANPTAKR